MALLDDMTKIKRAWYTCDNLISSMPRGPSKEKMKKDQERDENMAKMMTQLDLLMKYVMHSSRRSVNVVGYASSVPYEATYNEEVH